MRIVFSAKLQDQTTDMEYRDNEGNIITKIKNGELKIFETARKDQSRQSDLMRCKSCQFWESKDREKGYCNKSEDLGNTMFWIEDTTAYRPILKTDKDFYCVLFQLHENVHTPGGDF